MSIVHVLNGDSTAQSFADTGLEGDVIIWREVMSEGPVAENVTSGEFWKNRRDWICQGFNEAPEKYDEKVLSGLAKLDDDYDEISLWFEFDLHCQINMLVAMNYLNQRADMSLPSVYLVCPDSFPEKEHFAGMGELNGSDLEYLYDNVRVQLSEIDFVIAAEAWKVYVTFNVRKLKAWIDNTEFWGSLHLLKPALEAQLKRLQLNENGLNYIQQKLLDIYNYGYKTKIAIYQKFWETEKIYGMGDMEIDIYLHQLEGKGLIELQ